MKIELLTYNILNLFKKAQNVIIMYSESMEFFLWRYLKNNATETIEIKTINFNRVMKKIIYII
jgi:hypothetical protein